MVLNATFNNIASISWWRKSEYTEKTTDLSQVTDKLIFNGIQLAKSGLLIDRTSSISSTNIAVPIGMHMSFIIKKKLCINYG